MRRDRIGEERARGGDVIASRHEHVDHLAVSVDSSTHRAPHAANSRTSHQRTSSYRQHAGTDAPRVRVAPIPNPIIGIPTPSAALGAWWRPGVVELLHDLFIQLTKLKNTLSWKMGEEAITHLGREYYDEFPEIDA